jgi:hypothetical protein
MMSAFHNFNKQLAVREINDEKKSSLDQTSGRFFDKREYSYFNNLFEKDDDVLRFLAEHDQIEKWELDERMMVLIVILLEVFKNSLNYTLDKAEMSVQKKKLGEMILMGNCRISKVQPIESLTLIITQIVVISYYFCYHFDKAYTIKPSQIVILLGYMSHKVVYDLR